MSKKSIKIKEMKEILFDIEFWINKEKEADISSCVTATEGQMGFIVMKDGRIAQVQVTLQIDPDEWILMM